MFCTRCGKEAIEGSAFCTGCGAKLDHGDESAESVVAPAGTNSADADSAPADTVEAGSAASDFSGADPASTSTLDSELVMAELSDTDSAMMGPTEEASPEGKASRKKKGLIGGIIGIAAAVIVVVVVVVYNTFFISYTIDEEHFPDETLRSQVAEQADQDGDGVLSDDETAAVENLSITGASSLDGLDIFPNLHSVTLQGEQMAKADLQGFSELRSVSAKDCKNLTELDLSSSDKVESIDVTGTSVSELDLAGKSGLILIACDNKVVLKNLDDTPLHEYWVVESYKASDPSSAHAPDVKATYDERGNLVKLVSNHVQAGTTTYTYAYDDKDRCISTRLTGNNIDEAYKIAYNDKGLMTKAESTVNMGNGVSGPGTSEVVSYNDQGLPLTHDYIVNQGGASLEKLAYDKSGALTSIKEASVNETTYSMTNDDAGRMTSISYALGNGDPVAYKIGYNKAGRVAKVVKTSGANSVETAFAYDDKGRLTNATNRNIPAGQDLKYQLADISSTKFEYDANGNLVEVTPVRAGTGLVQSYSLTYKRLLTTRDEAPNFNFIDLSNPLAPHMNPLFWSMEAYLWPDNLAYQGSMKNVMAKVSPTTAENQ